MSNLVLAELIDRQKRLVFPGDQHVADIALDERDGRPRAPVSSTGTFAKIAFTKVAGFLLGTAEIFFNA